MTFHMFPSQEFAIQFTILFPFPCNQRLVSICCLHVGAGNIEMNKLVPWPWGAHSLKGEWVAGELVDIFCTF